MNRSISRGRRVDEYRPLDSIPGKTLTPLAAPQGGPELEVTEMRLMLLAVVLALALFLAMAIGTSADFPSCC